MKFTVVSKFKCKDIGMKCDFEVKNATSKDEVMEIAQVHAIRAHGITSPTPDLQTPVAAAVKD